MGLHDSAKIVVGENRLNEARDLLRQLNQRNINPQPFMYNPVIDGFCKAGNVDEANISFYFTYNLTNVEKGAGCLIISEDPKICNLPGNSGNNFHYRKDHGQPICEVCQDNGLRRWGQLL
ncbi:Pentatricopeptide repeat [Dillenia turbinata]|uniref:Pentatricopeptide repeat n=1 Tax=Dillenia turbinata TaxID=194707 RepID=A0AAN8ZDK5_9MAGN